MFPRWKYSLFQSWYRRTLAFQKPLALFSKIINCFTNIFDSKQLKYSPKVHIFALRRENGNSRRNAYLFAWIPRGVWGHTPSKHFWNPKLGDAISCILTIQICSKIYTNCIWNKRRKSAQKINKLLTIIYHYLVVKTCNNLNRFC
jgi:hypothetical protein